MTSKDLIIACVMNPGLVQERLEEWRAIVSTATTVESRDDGVALHLPPTTDLQPVASLVAAEHECCPFFSFTLTVSSTGGRQLLVTAPPEARDLVDALLSLRGPTEGA